MSEEKLISIHCFMQAYYDESLKESNVALVYLTINHPKRQYTITPTMPEVGYLDSGGSGYRFTTIDHVAFQIKDVGQNFARAFATQAAIFKAMLYACEELSLARPTQVRDIRKMFDEDVPLTDPDTASGPGHHPSHCA